MSNPYLTEFRKLNPRSIDYWEHRKILVDEFAWAIPNDQAIKALVELSPIVEIGAGKGYWARLVEDAGGDINCYDIAPHHDSWLYVVKGGPEVLKEYRNWTLFLCWPPYDDPMAYKCLARYRGNTVVVVGEVYGATGDDKFWDSLERRWNLVREIKIPQWDCIHDTMMIFTRKQMGE